MVKMLKFHWSHEVYSLDFLYRYVYRYPRFLPLCISTEHGVCFTSEYDRAIQKIKFKGLMFFTWNSRTIIENMGAASPKFVGQIHPWVIFKEQNDLKIDSERSGTLFFPYHTVPGIRSEGEDDERSVRFLEDEKVIKPVTVCLHWNDFESRRRKYFEDNGFLVTYVGNPNSDDFMMNFFDLVKDKKYAVVEGWSSAVSFLIDLGIPTIMLHREISAYSDGGPQNDWGFSNSEFRNEYKDVFNLFKNQVESPTSEQLLFVQKLLGYQYRRNRKRNMALIWLSLFIVGPQWASVKFMLKVVFNLKRFIRVTGRILRHEPLRSSHRIDEV
jgi:hypothetical protein